MRKLVAVAALAACAAAGLAVPSPGSKPSRAAQLDEPDGMLVLAVLAPDERAIVADPRTGAARERRLPGGTLCHGPLVVVGDRVILSGSRGTRPVALSLPLTLRGRARSLGPAVTFAASPTPGRLWLGRSTSLREVDLEGRVIARSTQRLERWSSVEAVTDVGFLSAGRRGLTLRHPLGRMRRSFRDGWLVAARGPRFAWCRGDCRRLELWSRHGERTLDPPAGLRPEPGGRAAFSPDGRHLAVAVRTRRGVRAGVIDLTRDSWHVVAGARLSDYRSLAWSPSGRWLYLAATGHRLLAWRLGSARPVGLAVRPGGTVMSIATTEGPA